MPGDVSRLDEYVTRHARQRPDAPAVACDEFRWTYGELEERVEACGRALLDRGVTPGDVVAVHGHSRPECLVVFLACCRTGAIYLGLNPKHTRRELALVAGDAKPRLVLATEPVPDLHELGGEACDLDRFLATADGAAPAGAARRDPGQPCALVYTSGSTGTPKGALLSHTAIMRTTTLTVEHWYGGVTGIRTIAQHPVNHVSWLVCECAAVVLGGGMLYFRERFDAAATLRLTTQERLDLWFGFPSMVALITRSDEFARCDLSSLRRVAFGSQPPIDLLERLRERTDAVCAASYGLTEAGGGALIATRDDDTPETIAGTIGRALPGVETRVVDPDGRSVPTDEPGELLVRDESLFLGYLGRPDATAAALDGDGWLHTGDAVARDGHGRFRLVGRLREMFKSGGYNVYPTEVEGVLVRHAGVGDVAVIGIPDPTWSEVGVAFVVLAAGRAVTVDDLREDARSQLANYKVPKRFVVVDRLPRLPNGKPDRAKLRELAVHADETR